MVLSTVIVPLAAIGVVFVQGPPSQETTTIQQQLPVVGKQLPETDRAGRLAARASEIERYLNQTVRLSKLDPAGEILGSELIVPYEFYAYGPTGANGAELVPQILFRILPELAIELGEVSPEDPDEPLFGTPGDNPFAKFGFWTDPRPSARNRPLPIGFTWTPGRPGDQIPLSMSIRTCAGCHTGRVRLENGTIQVLEGAPNTEILLNQYNTTLSTFLVKYLDDDRIDQFEALIIRLVDEYHATDPNYFFKDAEGYGLVEEARQVAMFKELLGKPAEEGGILELMKRAAEVKLKSLESLATVAYHKPNAPNATGGPPGLIESSGTGIAAFVVAAGLDPTAVFSPVATKNDVPSVWNQWTRKQWQWDGNIRDVLARNLIASLGLVGRPDQMDITANTVISEFIDYLPPPIYPFEMPAPALIDRGRILYETNCLACHREDQRRGDGNPLTVFDLGTDPNRAKVVTPVAFELTKASLVASFQPADLRFRIGDNEYQPNFEVDGEELLIRRFTPESQGYVAAPLDGIWARAPYLHNGAVPTLMHLLVPKLRDQTPVFVRGAISFDQDNVGWEWSIDHWDRLRAENRSARLYDTSKDGQSNAGHDQSEWIDLEGKVGSPGKSYRLAWDDWTDPEVLALIAYLKTL